MTFVELQPVAKAEYLVVFSTDSCAPCEAFYSAYDSNKDGLKDFLKNRFDKAPDGVYYYKVTMLEDGTSSNEELVRYHKKSTNKDILSAPTFWIYGDNRDIVGYKTPKILMQDISK